MEKIIYLILIFIIYILGSTLVKKSSVQLKKFTEKFTEKSKEKNDWLEDLFEYRQIITIPERVEHVKKFCKSFDIKPTIFKAILKKDLVYNNVYNLKIGEIACALSQEAVLKNFIDSQKKSMLMLEDDNIPFTNEFYKNVGLKLNFVKDYVTKCVETLPMDWDVLYFGRCWDDCANHTPYNNYIVKTKRTLCHHAIAFSRKGASIILAHITHPLNVPIDHVVANLTSSGKINTYASILPIFYQNRIELNSTIGNYDHLPICM